MNFEHRDDLVRRIEDDLLDSLDEELELEIEDRTDTLPEGEGQGTPQERHAQRVAYFKELFRLQAELVKLQDWVALNTPEGRDPF